MGADFNGGEINTSVTEVDLPPRPRILSLDLRCAGDQRRRLTALMWMAAHKTYSQTKVLYPAAKWAEVEEYASSLI